MPFSSSSFLEKVFRVLDARFPRTGVRIDAPAIVLPFGAEREETTEVVPAELKRTTWQGHRVYQIASRGGGWLESSPDAQGAYVDEVNTKLAKKVKPLIRFVKGWKYYNDVPVESFYLELWVAQYASGENSIVYRIDVASILRNLAELRLAPIADRCGAQETLANSGRRGHPDRGLARDPCRQVECQPSQCPWSEPMRLESLLSASSILATLVGCTSPAQSSSARAALDRPATGFVTVEGGRVAYEVHGTGTRTPLLVLHGGPGIPHDYLANLALLGDERPVVFYDQLGCGLSDRPDDPALWTRERFAREVDAMRLALGLEEVVLYGHSWGSILAVDYLTGASGERPCGVRGAILAGPALSIPRWIEDSRRLISSLPEDVAEAILEGERTGDTDSEAYRAATQAFYARYVCRSDPWPEELERAFAGMGEQVYVSMNGPTEFTITGPLRTVDVTPRLGELGVPVLYICGEHDEATPESTRAYAALTPDSEVVVVEGAAHVANYDRPTEYMGALRRWLSRHDGL